MNQVSPRNTYWFAIFVCLFCSINFLSAQIVINEFSASNKSDFADNNGEYKDWIELYNTSNSTVNLAGYYLSDKLNNPTKWTFPNGVSMDANEHLVIFATGDDTVNGSFIHTNFKLTQTKQESIILSDPNGDLLDAVQMINPTQRNHSRGRLHDGSSGWGVFANPSPRFPNNYGKNEYTSKPVFNQEAGFYQGSQNIEIYAEADATIRYTLNGETPTSNSPIYNGAIFISETTVIRTKAFSNNDNLADSFVETNTFFINETVSLPVLSFADDYYDTTLFGSKQEITTSLEFFDENQSFTFEMDGDMRGHGNDSWAFDQKGMRFYTRDEYGSANNIEYPIFETSPRDEFDVVIIRALGSDNYPGQGWRPSCHVRDPFVQSLADDNGMHLDIRRHRYTLVFINGEYWGIYSFRERIDSDFTKYYFDQGKSHVDMLEYWGGLEARYGDNSDWVELYNYMTSNDLSIPSNYAYVEERMNLLSVIDYSVLNTFTVNTDWLNWNSKWWQGTKGDGTGWRYCLWDMDNTFNLGENYTGLPTTTFESDPCDVNTIYDNEGPDIGHIAMLNALLENEDFQKLYFERYAELMNTVFTCDNLTQHLDSLLTIIEPEMPRQIERWGGTMSEWQQNVERLRSQIMGKCNIVGDQLVDCYEDEGLEGPYSINIQVEPAGAGQVIMNDITAPSFPWEVTYFGGLDVHLQTLANGNFVFSHWTVNNNAFTPDEFASEIALTLQSDDHIVAHYTAENPCLGATILPTIVGELAICQGSTTDLAISQSFSSYWWSTEATSNSITVSEAGIYTVTVSDHLGCTSSASVEVVESAALHPTIFGDTAYCAGNSVTLVANDIFDTYLWSNGAQTQVLQDVQAGIYTVTVSYEGGCTGTATQEVIEYENPDFELLGQTQLCAGSTSFLEPSDPINVEEYTWNTGENTATIEALLEGYYCLTITDVNGCTASSEATLTSLENPMPEILGATSFCAGGTTSLSTNDYAQILWSTEETSHTISLHQAGDYSVTVVDQNGCSGSNSISIEENVILPFSILGATSFCGGSSTILSVSSDFENYIWSNENTNNQIEVHQAGNYSVTVVDANGCSGTQSIEVIENESLIFEIQGETQLCTGESSVLNAGNNFATYLWSNEATTATIEVAESGIYSLTVTDSNGCSGTQYIEVSVAENPVFEIIGSPQICTGQSSNLSTNTAFESYVWSTENTDSNIDISSAGLYAVTVSNASGCTGFASFEVEEFTMPLAAIDGPVSFCENTTATLTAPSDFESYQWSTGSEIFETEVSQSGTYSLIITDENGCSSESLFTIETTPNPSPIVLGDLAICEGASTIISTENTYLDYDWSTGEITSEIEVNTAATWSLTAMDMNGCVGTTTFETALLAASTSHETIQLCYGESYDGTAYTQSAVLTESFANAAQCDSIHTTQIEVLPAIDLQLVAKDNCDGTGQLSTNLSTDYDFLWSNHSSDMVLENMPAGTYEVTVSNAFGCSQTSAVTLTTAPAFSLATEVHSISCFGANDGSIFVEPLGGTPPYTSTWSVENLAAHPMDLSAGIYSILMSDANDCSVFTSLEIQEPAPLHIDFLNTNTALGITTTAIVSGGTPPYQYQWNTGATLPSIENQVAGIYQLSVTDANGCDINLEVDNTTTATESVNTFIALDVFPNPTHNRLYIQAENPYRATKSLMLTNTLGQVLIQKTVQKNTFSEELNLSLFPAGTYFLILKGAYGIHVEKVVLL